MIWIKTLLFSAFTLLMTSLNAQSVEMATGMRSDGKIYVVVAVLVLMFVGFVVYLIATDSRLKKLEKEVEEHLEKES